MKITMRLLTVTSILTCSFFLSSLSYAVGAASFSVCGESVTYSTLESRQNSSGGTGRDHQAYQDAATFEAAGNKVILCSVKEGPQQGRYLIVKRHNAGSYSVADEAFVYPL